MIGLYANLTILEGFRILNVLNVECVVFFPFIYMQNFADLETDGINYGRENKLHRFQLLSADIILKVPKPNCVHYDYCMLQILLFWFIYMQNFIDLETDGTNDRRLMKLQRMQFL